MEIKEIKEKVKKLKDELKSKELKKEGSSSMGYDTYRMGCK